MNSREAIDILKGHRAELQRRGVAHAAVFGSTVRAENRPDSDLDLLVDIDPAADIGVYEYVALTRFIGELFPVPVDVANRATLQPHVRPSAEREAIYAF
ncbi:nucleotidyltransferase family protein [Brevundimonas sp.]|uniref:nucleotidyltransferase family protein n=1 Tax=unclassified Brevundimonas TaxID=2622653 RepID=UPI0027371BDF|nr:nucleotidyltransferase family protein [Brevundimonas sp.]MDP3404506.1 nucleotidyltransferase family protein [Brevundimonas sp.]